MQTLTPGEVRKRFGKMFSRSFFTLVDEKRGLVQIIEKCSVKGPVEWDAINRMRAGGALRSVDIDGTTLVMNAKIGKGRVNFGPVSKTSGGQALKSVVVRGDEVLTTWAGLAGASVGVGACLPQSPGVLRAMYHVRRSGEIRLGGSNAIEVTIVSPRRVRLLIGIDDTDTKEKGATWVLALKLAEALEREIPGARHLHHRIVQLNPDIREKTTNCASTVVSFAVKEKVIGKSIGFAKKFLKKSTFSDNTAIAVFTGLVIPQKLKQYGLDAKRKRLGIDAALKVAGACGVGLIEITGSRGAVGALAAIGCFDMGPRAAGLHGEKF